jgi:hypothetical protein
MRPSICLTLLDREFSAAREGHHVPVMLWGPPGVGKSSLVAAVARKHGVALVDLRLAQMEPTDLRGIPFRSGDDVRWAIPAMLPRAERDGAAGILFLDELTSALPTVTAAAYQLILDRRLGEYAVPPGWAIFAAGNRVGDRGVTFHMPAPLANRFSHYELEPDLEDWAAWALGASVDARVVAFLRFRPDLLFHFDPARQQYAYPTPRSWWYASEALGKFADDAEILREGLAGAVGEAAALTFAAWLRHADQLPSPADVLGGRCERVPEPIDLQYALAGALVQHMLRLPEAERGAALAALLSFARRFPSREIGLMLVSDLGRVLDRPLFALPAFRDWAAELSGALAPDAR